MVAAAPLAAIPSQQAALRACMCAKTRTCGKGVVFLAASLVSTQSVFRRFVGCKVDGVRRAWAAVSFVSRYAVDDQAHLLPR